MEMQCTSCSEEIPDDSIFCPECGSRQDLSRANFGSDTSTLGGDESSGARTHGVVSSEAIAFFVTGILFKRYGMSKVFVMSFICAIVGMAAIIIVTEAAEGDV